MATSKKKTTKIPLLKSKSRKSAPPPWANELDIWNQEIESINAYLTQQGINKAIAPLTVEDVLNSGEEWPGIINSSMAYETDNMLETITNAYIACIQHHNEEGMEKIENLLQKYVPDGHQPYWTTGLLWACAFIPEAANILKRFPDTDLEIFYDNDRDGLGILFLRTIALYTPQEIHENPEIFKSLVDDTIELIDDIPWYRIEPRTFIRAFDVLVDQQSITVQIPIDEDDDILNFLTKMPTIALSKYGCLFNAEKFCDRLIQGQIRIDSDWSFNYAFLKIANIVGPERACTLALLHEWRNRTDNTNSLKVKHNLYLLLQNIPALYPDIHTWKSKSLWVEAANILRASSIEYNDIHPALSVNEIPQKTLEIATSLGTIDLIINDVRNGTFTGPVKSLQTLDLPDDHGVNVF